MAVEQVVIGAVAGVVFGLYGYLTKREWTQDSGFESFNYRKIGRTIVVYAAAGALVGYMGEPITEGRVEAATATTIVVGEVFDRLVSAIQREARRKGATQGR